MSSAINLRLRTSKNSSRFRSYASTMDTLLHELAHFKHGHPNRAFYDFLHELRK